MIRVVLALAVFVAALSPARANRVVEQHRPAVADYVDNLVGRGEAPAIEPRQPARQFLVELLANQQIPRGLLSKLVRNPRYASVLPEVLRGLVELDGDNPEDSTPGLDLLARELAEEADATRAAALVELLRGLVARRERVALAPAGDWFSIRVVAANRQRSLLASTLSLEERHPATTDYLNRLVERAPRTTRVALGSGSPARADLLELLGNQQLPWHELSEMVRNTNASHRLEAILQALRVLDGRSPAQSVPRLRELVAYLGRAANALSVDRVAYFLGAVARGKKDIVRIFTRDRFVLAHRVGGTITVAVLADKVEAAMDVLGRPEFAAMRFDVYTTGDAAAIEARLGERASVVMLPMPATDARVATLEARLQTQRAELRRIEAALRGERGEATQPLELNRRVRPVRRPVARSVYWRLSDEKRLGILARELETVDAELARKGELPKAVSARRQRGANPPRPRPIRRR